MVPFVQEANLPTQPYNIPSIFPSLAQPLELNRAPSYKPTNSEFPSTMKQQSSKPSSHDSFLHEAVIAGAAAASAGAVSVN